MMDGPSCRRSGSTSDPSDEQPEDAHEHDDPSPCADRDDRARALVQPALQQQTDEAAQQSCADRRPPVDGRFGVSARAGGHSAHAPPAEVSEDHQAKDGNDEPCDDPCKITSPCPIELGEIRFVIRSRCCVPRRSHGPILAGLVKDVRQWSLRGGNRHTSSCRAVFAGVRASCHRHSRCGSG